MILATHYAPGAACRQQRQKAAIVHSSLLASTTLVIWKALETYDLDARTIFERAGLNPSRLEEPSARYRYTSVRLLWELAIEESGDPCFALTAATQWHPSNFHGLGYAWLASSSLKEAMERLIRYFRVVTTDPEELTLTEHKDEYVFAIDSSQVAYRALDVEYDFLLLLLVDACRLSAGEEFSMRGVKLQRPVLDCAERYERFFATRVEFDAPRYAISFDKATLERHLPTGNAELGRANDQVIQAYLARLNRSDVVMRAKVALLEHLPSGQVSEEVVAQALNMSLRTMQRKLRDETTSYKELLEETRRDLAQEYVRNPHVAIGEITYLLGFSEPSSFSRAFRRWTGRSPTEFRDAAQSD